jgi:hypothetical protein
MSTDHGLHFSTPEEISGVSPTLCFLGNRLDPTENANACDFSEAPDPEVLPNGDLVVVFLNRNTAPGNPNRQELAVVCHPTGSSPLGTAHLNCDAAVKVGDDIIAGEPRCDFGRGPEECVPGAFVRTEDLPRIGVNAANGNLYAVWQDYRNGEYDIQLSQSTTGGTSWTASTTVNPDTGLDHYLPAIDAADQSRGESDLVGVSYYRTERVPAEGPGLWDPAAPGVGAGSSDFVQAGGRDLATPYAFKVVSPIFPAPDGAQRGFIGDYSGLVITGSGQCHPVWSDTRNPDTIAPPPESPTNGVVRDEDIFTDTLACPEGHATLGPGTLGRS